MISGLTVFEASKKRPGDKRKKERNNDPSDIEGYLGPWAKYKDEQTTMKPSEVGQYTIVYILVYIVELIYFTC